MNATTIKTMTPVTLPVTVTGSTLSNAVPTTVERNKQWQRELLMERIRSHASQQKTFPELSKLMRMSMLEKRYALDSVEKSNLQKCLDSMQHVIKVTSRQGLVERLESLSRQLGLKFMEDTSGLFISTDMFFLEIILDANGTLTDVKVHHECKIEQQSCSELVNCLNRGDFADFTTQLEGLSSIYQLNAEPKVKTKAFVALQAMETDLYNLFQVQNFSKDTQQMLNESTVGIVLKRRGGHPMKLTYFVSPYDLICLETKSMQPLSIDLVTSKHVGLSVTVNLEASSANKLQVLPTISFVKDVQTGVEIPVYAPLTQINSTLLPANFVVRLNKPLPVCYATLRNLGIGGVAAGSDSSSSSTNELLQKTPAVSSIMSLIVQTASDQLLNNLQKGLFVCLPDQTHCYFFTENKQLKATLVSSVPFTEPAQVPKILAFLKHQALFYTLLSSCVRSQSKMGNDMDSTTILEVNATSFQQISVSLQHPYEESMVTIDFDLRNGTVNCIIYNPNQNYELVSLKLTKTVQRSLSIPVTIRALLKFWDQERLQMFHRSMGSGDGGISGSVGGSGTTSDNGGGFGNFSLAMGPNDSGGRGGSGTNASVKSEQNLRQQMQTVVTSSGTSVTDSIKLKNELKKEDFHESPKSQVSAQSVEVNSLGPNQPKQHGNNPQKQPTAQANASEIEIAGKYKNIWKSKTSNLKNCVSITPILNESTAVQKSIEVKQRNSGIEIIPLTSQNHGSGSNINGPTSTITITPINVNSSMKDKKALVASSSSSTSNCKRMFDSGLTLDSQKEKKRKKRRDDSPMGPPEKVYSRQNSPAATNDAAAASAATRKFSSPSSSPKGASGGILTSVGGSASLSTRPSPKHSPVYSSPKHIASSNSPKSPFGTQSPKHGSSGKPSMSTLKSAAATATSLSPKGGDTKCAAASISNVTVGIMKNRDKDNSALPISSTGLGTTASLAISSIAGAGGALKSNAGVVSAMHQLKSSAVLHHNSVNDGFGGIGGTSAGAMEINAAIRKGVASAVSLMTSTAATTTLTTPPQYQPQHQLHGNSELNCSSSSQSSEYMVKTSREGLKLTINKTNNKTSASKVKTNVGENSLDAVSSKKQHTGLKPGVNSGPASKKITTVPSSTDSSRTNCTTTIAGKFASNISMPSSSSTSALSLVKSSSQCTKHKFQKSNSSGNLSAKTPHFAGGSTSVLSKSNSASSFTDLVAIRKSNNNSFSKKTFEGERLSTSSSASQPATRLDHHMDMMKILQYASPAMAANMEGFIKGLNSKFHIPKLSQRTSVTSTPSTTGLEKMHCSSASPTPTNVSAPATILGSTSAALPAENVVLLSKTSRAVDPTCCKQQQQQHNDNEGKIVQHQQNLKLPRSPPPPYHIAIAAGNLAAPSMPNATTTANVAKSSVSVHILKSSTTSISPAIPLVSEQEKKIVNLQLPEQSVEFLKNIVSDDVLIPTLRGE